MSTYTVPLDADVVTLFTNNDDGYNVSGDLEVDLPQPSSRAVTQPVLRVNIGFDDFAAPTNLIIKCTTGSMTVGTSTLSTHTINLPGAQSYSFVFVLINGAVWRGELEHTGPVKYW